MCVCVRVCKLVHICSVSMVHVYVIQATYPKMSAILYMQ